MPIASTAAKLIPGNGQADAEVREDVGEQRPMYRPAETALIGPVST